jgi:hypothetical protein
MFDKTAVRRAFSLILSLCIVVSLVPVSIGSSAPAVSPQPRPMSPCCKKSRGVSCRPRPSSCWAMEIR